MVALLDNSESTSKTALRARGATLLLQSRRATAVKSSNRTELGRPTYDARRRLGSCSNEGTGLLLRDNLYAYVWNRPTNWRDPSGLTTLDSKIEWHLIYRILQFGKLLDVGDTLSLKDEEGEFKKSFGADISTIFLKEADRHRDNVFCDSHSSCFKQILEPASNPSGEWRWPSTASFDTGWWLNGAHSVRGELRYCIECIDGLIVMTNLRSTWVWRDRIDARGVKQWWRAKETWRETFVGIPNLLIESLLWDKLVDGLLDADFGVEIKTPVITISDKSTAVPCTKCPSC